MTLRRALIRAFDRPGGRKVLGTVVTRMARRYAPGVRVYYRRGMWMHHVGESIFVDFPSLDYHPTIFRYWANEVDRCYSDAQDHWFYLYKGRPGDLIVDVGAGKGEDTTAFSQTVGAQGRVISIEANPITFRCLVLFCELNHLRNVTPINYAVVDKAGPVAMEATERWQADNVNGTTGSAVVQGVTLDDIVERENIRRVDFLKMNIEGAEIRAVDGMEKTLRITQALCISCHDFRANGGDGEHFRTKERIQTIVKQAGFRLVSREADWRPCVADQINATRY
jgi:FkbM family methyltransferase